MIRGLLAGSTLLVTGCPGVDLGDTPEDIGLCNPTKGFEYWRDSVFPMFVARGGPSDTTSCIRSGGGCHDMGGGNALSFPSAVAADTGNYRAAQVYLNCGTPSASELLTKPLKGVDDPHGGGDIYPNTDDATVKIFLDWFAAQ